MVDNWMLTPYNIGMKIREIRAKMKAKKRAKLRSTVWAKESSEELEIQEQYAKFLDGCEAEDVNVIAGEERTEEEDGKRSL